VPPTSFVARVQQTESFFSHHHGAWARGMPVEMASMTLCLGFMAVEITGNLDYFVISLCKDLVSSQHGL